MKAKIKYFLPVFLAVVMFACTGSVEGEVDGSDNVLKELVAAVAPDGLLPDMPRKVKPDDIKFVKSFLYDQYTLEDVYPYKDTVRRFQWNTIRNALVLIENAQIGDSEFGVIQNRRNNKGEPPLVEDWTRNKYKNIVDTYGVERYQAAPLYDPADTLTPDRYASDGGWLIIDGAEGTFLKVRHVYYESEWLIPAKYVKKLGKPSLDRVACVDRTNQNITTVERTDSAWLIRSMNPATTGINNPPYAKETPLGIYVVQEKKIKMYYYVDGTTTIAGYAPWASRFCQGAYIHGVPTNDPNGSIIEYGWTLGTTPRSHMCVRNSSSHAKYVYDWAEVGKSLVFVLE